VPPGEIPNPILDARVKDKAVENVVFQTTAQRLMRRAHTSSFEVTIDEDIIIQMHTPTDGEYMELIRLQNDILKTGMRLQKDGVSDIDQATGAIDEISSGWDRLHGLIAKLCIDPSLDFEFFQSGQISAADKTAIIKGIINQVQNNQDSTIKFREEQSGA
jgi:hypothetical protein